MNFGAAIEAVKRGQKVGRRGWNGKGMCVYLNKGSLPVSIKSPFVAGVFYDLFEQGEDDTIIRMPNLNMTAADGATVTGWLASQTDMLAEDWEIIDG